MRCDMTVDTNLNPAEKASEEALAGIRDCLNKGNSFLLEAGAGAGKTYSLIETLKYLILNRGDYLLKNNQKIACITYTNVAADEIISRTDSHPAIYSSTIHAFCWSLIHDFQPFLRQRLEAIDAWSEKIAEAGGIKSQRVIYDLGYRKITDEEITLHHDDVLSLIVELLKEKKFKSIFSKRYPIIFVDEYQDTELAFVEALKAAFLDTHIGVVIGFFGDHWQKIYGSGCGTIEHPNLVKIDKKANFRSASIIVNALNRIRTDLPQHVRDPNSLGTVSVFHTNNWQGQRLTGNHWSGDLPSDASNIYLKNIRAHLENEGWDFSPEKAKILMLTHNALAAQQGYKNLANVFPYNDSFIKKGDPHISFFAETLEPVCKAYENKKFGEMFSLLGRRTPILSSLATKESWVKDMDALVELRKSGTVGDIINHLLHAKRPRFPEGIENKERKLNEWIKSEEAEENRTLSELKKFKEISYSEVMALVNFLNDSTPFNTKHGVKGAEFENVLVVFGRGWNQYNFGQFLEWSGSGIPAGKNDSYERNRNLFYVACSRPKKRLCLLFTQELTPIGLQTLSNWFGVQNIKAA
jgi:DNA helicase II / ATP-dependent DNA helicase PcrA